MQVDSIGNVGIRANYFQWLKSYLTDRSQSVRTCGSESNSFKPTSGVHQESDLGPLLFCLHINLDINDTSLDFKVYVSYYFTQICKDFFYNQRDE